MTFGQPQQLGPYPYQHQYQPPASPRNPRVALLTAPTAYHAERLFQVGFGVALAGLMLLIFSCLSWLSFDDGDTGITASVSGLGSVSMDGVGGETARRAVASTEAMMNAPGGWTLAFGVFLLVAGAALVARRFQPLAAAAAAAFGFAAFVCGVVFFSDPVDSLSDFATDSDHEEASRGYGIWVVFAFGIVALRLGAYALILVTFPEKFRPTHAGVAAAGYAAPQQLGRPTQFGQPGTGAQPQQFGPSPSTGAHAQQYGGPQQFGRPQQYGQAQQYGQDEQYWQPAEPHHSQQYGAQPQPGGPAYDQTQLGLPQNPGPQNPGPQNPGPQNPGPQNPGPQNPGQQDPGRQYPGYSQPPQQ